MPPSPDLAEEVQLILPPVEPEEDLLPHNISMSQPERGGREGSRRTPFCRALWIDQEHATRSSYGDQQGSEDHDGDASGSPGHVFGKRPGDHDTSVAGIEPGEAAAVEALPVVVV